MTALVTGATGFVGSAVARALLARGETVRVMARAGSDRRNLEGLSVEIVEGDLRDADARRKAVQGASSLYHVAADYRLWTRDPAAMFATNVEATAALLREAADAGASRMVYTSSVATLGLFPDGREADEVTPVSAADMIGPYKRSKFDAEERVRALAAAGLPIVIVNPTAPVGPRDVKPTPTGRTIVEAAAGRMPAFVDTGLNIVHVDDVARGHLLAHDKGTVGERYILGAENLTLQQILARIAAQVNRKAPTIQIPNAAIMPIAYAAEFFARVFNTGEPFVTVDGLKLARKRMFFSSAKAQRELGYTSRPVDEAISDALIWFRAHKYL
jgi:dihydroflavonol-4-reductase